MKYVFYAVQTSIDVAYGLNYISSINIGRLPFIGHTVKYVRDIIRHYGCSFYNG